MPDIQLTPLEKLPSERCCKIIELPAESYTRNAAGVWFQDEEPRIRLGGFYQKKNVQLPSQSLYRLHNAEIRGKGIITQDNHLIKDNLEGAPGFFRLQQQLSVEAAAKKQIDEPVFYILRYGVGNYGHCLTQIIPRLHWFHTLFPGIPLILHEKVPAQIIQALTRLGISEKNILRVDDEKISVRELYYANLWNNNFAHSPKVFPFIQSLKNTILATAPISSKPDKIFINRNDANTRHIDNHQEVAEYLNKKGFVELSCGNLSFEEQAEYFASAREIIGISGAALSNLVFCQPGTRVTLLSPDTMPSYYFWDIAHHTGVDYTVLYFRHVNKDKGIHSDFSVDISLLNTLIK